MRVSECRVEELALPTRAIQLSTDEAASAELREAEAVHQTHNSCCLLKAMTMTPCVCLELGASNRSEINICKAYA